MEKSRNEKRTAGSAAKGKTSRLKKLAIFLLIIAAISIFGTLAWRYYIADKLKDYLITLAEQSINGRIEYDAISVNVFTGKARVKNLRVFLIGESEPVIRVPNADVDVFALRDKKVNLNVEGATITLVREPDGSINLLGLYKKPVEEKKPEWDIFVGLSAIRVDFTDKLGIPKDEVEELRKSDGLLQFESALAGLGVIPVADFPVRDFTFTASFERISGFFRSTAASEETTTEIKGFHEGTPFNADFKMNALTKRSSGNLVWNDDNYSTLKKYAEQISPYISPMNIDFQLREIKASFAGATGGQFGVNVSGTIENGTASIPDLEKIEIASLGFEFDSGSGELRVKNLAASYGDARLASAGEISFKESTLDASADVSNLDLATVPFETPLKGVLDASVTLTGSLGSPDIKGNASLTGSSYDKVRLGTVLAKFNSNQTGVNIESISMSGGDLIASGSGHFSRDGSANIDFSIPPTSVDAFAKLADMQIPAKGRVAITGNLNYSKSGGLRVTGNASSAELNTGGKLLGVVRTGFSFDGRNTNLSNLSFNWDAGGGVTVRTLAHVSTSGLAGGATKFSVDGRSVFAGMKSFEQPEEARLATDFVGLLPMTDEAGLFFDPNQPQRGIVIYSTDPTRIGMEVWWPRLPENADAVDAESVSLTGEVVIPAAEFEPSAPSPGWLMHGVLSAAAPASPRTVVMQAGGYPEVTFSVDAEIGGGGGGKAQPFTATGDLKLERFFLQPILVELRGEGTLDNSRIYATATGRYKKRGFTARAGYGYKSKGNHDYDIHLLYGNSDFTLKGELNPADGAISASLNSEAIQLEDLLDLDGIYGSSQLAGDVSGTLANPKVKGALEFESAEYASSAPPYPTFELRDGSIPFAYGERAVHIAGGRMKFGESELSLSGLVSEGEMSVQLSSSEFSLGDVAGVLAPEVEIDGRGELIAKLSGTLHEPLYTLDFVQNAGAVNGIPFSDAVLAVSGDLELLHLKALRLGSEGGSVNASGDLSLDKEHRVSANLVLEKFQVGLITPLFMQKGDTALHGLVDGNASISGTVKSVVSEVSIELSEGRILNQEIEGILEFNTTKDEIRLTAFEASAGDSTVMMEGVIRDTIAQSELSIDIPYLDLALLNPFMNLSVEEGFWGVISAGTIAKQSERGPYMAGYLSGSGGLGFGIIALAGVSGNFNIYSDSIELREFKLTTEDSVLEADGDLPIKLLSPETRRAIEEGTLRDLPAGFAGGAARGRAPHEAPESERFNLSLRAENFKLDYLSRILPDTGISVGGTVTANLEVGGTPEFPIVEGTVDFAVRDFDYQNMVSVGSVDGKINVNYDPDIVAQTFWLENFVIGEPEAGAEQPAPRGRRSENADDAKKTHNITLDGGGSFRLMPFLLFDLGISGKLNNFERFLLSNIYRGPIAGEFVLEKDISDANIHVGGFVTLKQGGTFTIHAPEAQASAPKPLPVTFGTYLAAGTSEASGAIQPPQTGGRFSQRSLSPFKVFIEQGVNVRFPPIVDLRAEIQSAVDNSGKVSPLLIQGDFPNVSITGTLQSYKGSLIVLRHTFRVVDPPFEIRFDPMWGLVPYLRGRAAVVITQRSDASLAGFDSFAEDLTVYVNLDSLATELDDISMTSDPPLSQDEIARRLLGVLPPEGSVQGLTPEIREELYKVVGARVGRILEDKLNLDQFLLTIGDENVFYIDIEKELTDRISVLYSTELFGSDRSEKREQFGIRFLFLKRRLTRAYLELMYDNSDSKFQGHEIRIVLRQRY